MNKARELDAKALVEYALAYTSLNNFEHMVENSLKACRSCIILTFIPANYCTVDN